MTASGERHGRLYFEQLRKKLRWQLLFAYVTPLLILAFYFHFEYNATLREGIDNHLASAAENQRNTIDLFLRERVTNLKSSIRNENLTFPPSAEIMTKLLNEIRRESKTFVDLGLFNADGLLVAYAGPYPSLIGKNYSEEPWFEKISSNGRDSFISDVYLGFRGKPHYIIAVRRAVGSRSWTLRASVDPAKFGEFVGSSYLMKNAEAFIVNSAGEPQTNPDSSRTGRQPIQIAPRTPETLVTEAAVGGTTYLRAVAWLAENDWALVVQVPKSVAYAPIINARLVLSGIILVAICLIVVFVLRSTRKLIDRLEAADTTKEHLRAQLFNAAKLASIGEMAAGVAHEINNPLAIIHEEASMMLDIFDPQFGQEYNQDDFMERLGAIKEATMRGRAITAKLLTFARRHDPDPEPVDINRLLDRNLDTKEVDFKVSNIQVMRKYQDDLPPVMINSNQMDQVIINLLNNARDAIDGGGTITIRTLLEEDRVRIDISDTGCGMSSEVMEKIFFPFFTTKGVGKGTGLGLSISYGIIESHGGRITLHSEPGNGTTITILLPFEKNVERTARSSSPGGIHV